MGLESFGKFLVFLRLRNCENDKIDMVGLVRIICSKALPVRKE